MIKAIMRRVGFSGRTLNEHQLKQAAIDYFKQIVPHLANDKYFHCPSKSLTIRAFIKGAEYAQRN